jgi:hypothetical protein
MTARRDDRLREHLTALHDTPMAVRGVVPWHADITAVVIRPHVQDIDQVLGVAPRRKSLERAISLVLAREAVDQHHPNSGVAGIECHVAGRCGRQQDLIARGKLPSHVARGKTQHGCSTGLLHPQRFRRHGYQRVVQPGSGFERTHRVLELDVIVSGHQPLPLLLITLRPASAGIPPVTSAALA